MKKLKNILLSLLFLMAFTQIKAQVVTVSGSVNNVVDAYLGVKNALVASNNWDVKSKAAALLVAINTVPEDKLSADQHKLWLAYTDKLKFDSRHISESGDLDHQREHFASLSKNMYEVLNGLKLNRTVVYEQYCPMKKATWLSETSAIKNPYYGSKMLTCGKTTATLVPAL